MFNMLLILIFFIYLGQCWVITLSVNRIFLFTEFTKLQTGSLTIHYMVNENELNKGLIKGLVAYRDFILLMSNFGRHVI